MTLQDDLKTMNLHEALEKHGMSLKEAFNNAIIESEPIREESQAPSANYGIEDNHIVRHTLQGKQAIAKCTSEEDANRKIRHLKKVMENNAYSNVYRRNNGFEIRKSIGGRDVYYGSYPYCEQAILVAEELKKTGWDKSQLDRIRLRLAINRRTLRGRPSSKKKQGGCRHYVRTGSGKFRIIKTVNGKTGYFGTYDSEEDVKRMVKALEKSGWDKSRLKDIRTDMGV